MRPQGRSPPFLLIGLCVALCILGFNYWSLSYRNRELGLQIADLQDQVRRSMSKRMTAERRGVTVVDELKKCESTLDMEKNEIARKESEVISLSEQLRNKVTEMTDCESKIKDVDEIRTNLKTCEENNIGINQELQKKKEELKVAIQQVVPAQDAERCKLCQGQWADEKKAFLNGIEKILGPAALMQLHEAGIDIGAYAQKIDAQNKQKVEQPNPQVNGPAVPVVQNNPIVNAANGQANPPVQEQPKPIQVQPAQDQTLQVQAQPAQNQLPQQQPVPAQQLAQVPQVPGGVVQVAQNLPQGQQIDQNAQNALLGNPAVGNMAETNVLGVNGDSAAKANGIQSQNSVGNLDDQHPGGDFVPMANPGVENAVQPANDALQQNQLPAEKVAEHAPANPAEQQPIVLEDPASNRVARPSDMNKTTAGNSLTGLLKSNTPPLPDVLLSDPNMSLSSRTPTQSVQTDAQMALHASQSNNNANNQTLDPKLGVGLGPPTANVAGESNAQMKFKQNVGRIPIDDNTGQILKDGSAKMANGRMIQDEDSIDKMQHNMNMEDDRMNHMKSIR